MYMHSLQTSCMLVDNLYLDLEKALHHVNRKITRFKITANR